MTRGSRTVTGAALLLLLAASACEDERRPEQEAPAVLSQGCLVNSDCAAPLVCAFQRCHVECVTTRDCDGNLRCVGALEPERVCQLEQEASCETSADCVAGFVCSQDGACRDVCARDSECVGEQVCVTGACAEPSELNEQGALPQTLPFTSCRVDGECPDGERCLGAVCRPECRESRDCGPGEACVGGACEVVEIPNCECLEDIDCRPGETCDDCACRAGSRPECSTAQDCADDQLCVNGSCQCQCREDRDCAGGQLCDGCACREPEATTVVEDATLRTALDVELMRGITEVRGTLLLTGNTLKSTAGLESLTTVGRLEISRLYPPFELLDGGLLSGLSGLSSIRGDLVIDTTPLRAFPLPEGLRVQGDVELTSVGATCEQLAVWLETLDVAGSVSVTYADGCYDTCVDGACATPP